MVQTELIARQSDAFDQLIVKPLWVITYHVVQLIFNINYLKFLITAVRQNIKSIKANLLQARIGRL